MGTDPFKTFSDSILYRGTLPSILINHEKYMPVVAQILEFLCQNHCCKHFVPHIQSYRLPTIFPAPR